MSERSPTTPSDSEEMRPPSEAPSRQETDRLCRDLIGKEVVDFDGDSIGEVEHVYYRELRGTPEWVGIKVGLTDKRLALAPLESSKFEDDKVQVQVPKSMVHDSMELAGESPSHQEELELYRYYNIRRITPASDSEIAAGDEPLKRWTQT
jgi:sporulation protein YlmC with PRC-barrel domain